MSTSSAGGDIADAAARPDLVAGSRLLERLSPLIRVYAAERSPTDSRLVVAAPHHAPANTKVSSGHDVETGPVALALARALGGKCVVAHEMRTFVDLNKSPREQQASVRHLGRLSFREADRILKLYYQSQLFATNPSTVIEIHGHVRGHFDIEVSAGCLLDERVPQDHALGDALRDFKLELVRGLSEASAFRASPPTVGVYPLDRDVRFAATGTHTFNKVEKLRELGVNVAGLHIELGPQLRRSPELPEHRELHEQLIACLEAAVRRFMQRIARPGERDFKEHLLGEFFFEKDPVSVLDIGGHILQPLPKEQVGRRVAAFSTPDMERFDLAEGQGIVLAQDQTFRTTVEVRVVRDEKIRLGAVGISKTLRTQLARQPGDVICAGRRPAGATHGLVVGYVAAIAEESPAEVAFVGSTIAAELAAPDASGHALSLRSAAAEAHGVSALPSDELPHDRAIALSVALATRLQVTFGDLVCFFPC